MPFGLKGIVDNIKIDYAAKTVYINDLKTSSKTLSEFKESIEYYNYNLQAAIYSVLVSYKLSEILNSSWKIQFSFVVIDKYQQVGIFEVSQDTLIRWDEKLSNTLEIARAHYITRDYSKPAEFIAQGKVII
jgi:phage-related protein